MASARKTRVRAPSKPAPLAQWIAAALGLLLTLAVLGYSLWEGLTQQPRPPQLSITAAAPVPGPGGFIVPLTVSNASDETAASVEVRGRIEQSGAVVEERRAAFAYVPGRGEARGGLVFAQDPRSGRLVMSVEGYEAP